MRVIKESLICLALALLSVFLLGSASLVWSLPGIVERQANVTRAELLVEVQRTESDANQRLTEALGEIRSVSRNADHRTGEALELVRVAERDGAAGLKKFAADTQGQLANLNDTLDRVADPVAQVAQQVNAAAPLYLDCDHNPDCLFNRVQGTSKSVEQIAQVIAQEAPKMTQHADALAASGVSIANSVDATGKEVATAAKRFNAPQTKLQAMRSWLVTIARIYGAI